jgi:cytochrome oxidase Cu insertion factor (SCO1/SenC/PrrC family)
MTRWLTVVVMVGLFAAGAGRPAWVQAGQGVAPALWRAAGVAQLANPIPAPPLSLRDLSGELVDLRDLRGRVVMVYFWATW